MSAFRWIVVALISIIAAFIPPSLAVVGAAQHVYDVPAVARVGADEFEASDARTALLSGVQTESASPSVAAHGASTTFSVWVVATNTASLADDAAGSYGPFHRLESPTQTPATAALQEANGEMWGATARGGLNPTVKAYQGPLPPGARGVEFTTPVRPSDVGLGRPGDIAIWRRGAPGVVDVNDDYVKIACTVVRNTQC